MLARVGRLAPLTGVIFAVLSFAGMAIAQPPPGVNASGEKILDFSRAHASSQRLADGLLIAGFAFFLLFVGSLRAHLRTSPDAESASTLALVAAGVLASGVAVYIGLDAASNAAPHALAPGAAQALNVLALDMVYPVLVGGFVFGIAAGVAILRSHRLPVWLGWASIVIGLIPLWILQFLLLYVWALVVSILIYRRSGTTGPSHIQAA